MVFDFTNDDIDQDDADENFDVDDVDDDAGGPDSTCIMHIAHQAELLKLQHFRRFLHSSGLSQLDFLLRVGTFFIWVQILNEVWCLLDG